MTYQGRAPEALELLNRLRQEQPRDRAAVAAAVEAYLTLKDFAKALQLAARELEPLTDSVDERALVARCYFHSPDPKQLRHTCDLLLENLRQTGITTRPSSFWPPCCPACPGMKTWTT